LDVYDSLLALTSWMYELILELEWPLVMAFESNLGNMSNLSNWTRGRQLLGYDLEINGLLKPSTVLIHLRD